MDLCRETLCHYSLLQNAKFWRDQIGRKIPSAKENPFPSDILSYTFFIYISCTFPCSLSYRVWSFNHPWNPQFSFQRRHRTKSKTQTEFYKNSTQVEASSCTSASTGASADVPFRSGLLAETCSFASGWNTHQAQMTLPGSQVAKAFSPTGYRQPSLGLQVTLTRSSDTGGFWLETEAKWNYIPIKPENK